MNNQIVGHLDGIFGREVRGWAAYTSGHHGPCKLSIQRLGVELGEIQCKYPRPDVAASRNIQENCGFVFRLPSLPPEPSKFLTELQFFEPASGRRIQLSTQKGDNVQATSTDQNVNASFVVKAILKEISSLKSEISLLKEGQIPKNKVDESAGSSVHSKAPVTYGDFLGGEKLEKLLTEKSRLIFCFGIIPWAFRHQRPQHILNRLKEIYNAGVIYFNPSFVKGALPKAAINQVDRDVLEVSFSTGLSSYDFYSCTGSHASSMIVSRLLGKIMDAAQTRPVIFSKVDHPSWYPFLGKAYSEPIIYDKMDLISDFANSTATTIEYERRLEDVADLIIASSASLIETISEKNKSVLIRNASTPEIFINSYKTRRERRLSGKPVVGYLGAISEWFDFDLLYASARRLKEFDFRIIGGCDTEIPERIRSLKNVEFIPEIPYEKVPEELGKFTVGVIPFKLTNLIRHVDPVKAYEYLACGLPVVATDMPELIDAPECVFKTRSKDSFINALKEAVRDSHNPKKMERRRALAELQTWGHRTSVLATHIDALKNRPSVSIVVLHYGNVTLTENCLYSIFKNTEGPVEVVVVDNADGALLSSPYVKSLRDKSAIIYENPGVNLGFAKGMNLGIRLTRGEFVVLANNDIYVTPGWLPRMVQHFAYKRDLGMLGPVTNMTGNEQKMRLVYSNIAEMELFSRHIGEEFSRRTYRTKNLAFFFTMVRRDVIAKVGLLSEDFGVGYFEDDDYCRRVAAAGYGIGIADDVFIHHEHSASFNLLDDSEKQKIFINNKKVYEKKWGPWTPHKYRDDPLFG